VLRLRGRVDADLDALVSWIADSEALHLFTGTRLQWPVTAHQLRDLLDRTPAMTAWTLVEDVHPDQPLGHFDLTCADTVARLGRVIIDPKRRGERLSHDLVGFALRKAHELRMKHVALNVIASNTPAIKTYQRLGFIPDQVQLRDGVIAMTYADTAMDHR
jgi:RimJ/RimL family protein N-acetyltransferase